MSDKVETTYVEMRVRDPARCRGKAVLGIHLSNDAARLPVRIVRERRAEVDAVLTAHAQDFDPGTTDHLARHLLP